MYAIHLSRSSLFCAQAARRSGERGLISVACKGRAATNPAPAAGGHACTSGHQDGKEAPCPLLAPVVSKAFPPWYAGRRAPAFSRNAWAKPGRSEAGLRTSAQSVRTRGISKATPSGWQTSRHAGQSLRHPRGPLLPPSPEKNRPGRPCGAWLPRKKTL